MKDFLIFQYLDDQCFESQTSISVIFAHQREYDNQQNISDEIKFFFQDHSFSDKLVVIIPEYATDSFKQFFISGKEDTFNRIPSKGDKYFDSNYFVYSFDRDGQLKSLVNQISEDQNQFFTHLFRSGNSEIFRKGNGLVESSSDHHFVFPSGKHSAKFIRTGNILINSPEIFFLTIQLFKYIKGKNFIYCDTSSINVLPYALLELKRRFGKKFKSPTINSFSSYEVFESRKIPFSKDSLVLISASTSGNIIDRLLQDRLAERDQILVLYFIGPPEKYGSHSSNILCNLTLGDDFKSGIEQFATHKNEIDCKLCTDHSRPIAVLGDVFLTIQPRIQSVLLSTDHQPKFLSNFIMNYRGKKEDDVLIKVFYKEDDANNDYEVFLDTKKLFSKMVLGLFPKYLEKLNRLINVYIPANVKYLIHLPDEGSKILAEYISKGINCAVAPEVLHIKNLANVLDKTGSVVIVASSIVTGRHLLHISRALRSNDKLSIIYFVGVSRTANEKYTATLRSNLSRGKDLSDTRPVISIEELNCPNEKANSSWKVERKFWESIIDKAEDTDELYKFAKARRQILLKNKETIGLCNEAFLLKFNNERLRLRKGFAFWNFKYSEAETFQSEVYFTIASIINNLEHKDTNEKYSLKQTNYIRNLISPDNFHRYNDGIIQAAILRAGQSECFAYDLDKDSSLKMRTILESIVDEFDKDHGEGLMEFLLAIGVKKLRLRFNDLTEILNACSSVENKIVSSMAKHIQKSLIHGK